MKTVSRPLALSVLLSTCGFALGIAACGGDDNIQGDGGSDGSTDVTLADRTTRDHQSSDVTQDVVGDAGDAALGEGAADSPVDALIDTSKDASKDAPMDGAKDASKDVFAKDASSDVSSSDSIIDSPPGDGPSDGGLAALYAFPTAVNTAYCQRLAFCCDGPDASAFNLSVCVDDFALSGGVADVNLANVHGGNISYDATSAAKCLTDIANLSCGSYTQAEEKAILADCSAAMTGKLNLGDTGCTSAWDCSAPGFCAGSGGSVLDPVYASDGGLTGDAGPSTGTCTQVHAVGKPCTDVGFYTDCTYLGNGSPAAYCSQDEAGVGTCVSDITAGNPCTFNQQCATQICDFVTGDCETSSVFSDPGDASVVCASF